MSTAFNMALGMSVIVGFGALSLDLGFANFARTQAQTAADSAAIAGAISLASGDESAVISQAQSWGQRNAVGTQPVIVSATDVLIGTLPDGGDCAAFDADANGLDVFVRVHTAGNPAFLSRIWGARNLDTAACAVARVIEPSVCTFIGLGANTVNGGSNYVVGYDSTIDLVPANSPDEQAAICSNADVDLNGGPTVEGGVRPGVGMVINGDTSDVTGATSALRSPMSYAPPTFPRGLKAWPAATGYRITAAKTIAPGNYSINSTLSITGNGKLTISPPGKVNLYSNNQTITLTGKGVVNPTRDPHNFAIYAKDTKVIKVSGTGAFYGLIYAPDANVDISGTSDFYGAVVAGDLDLNGGGRAKLYMDTSLLEEVQAGGIHLVR